jgi:hypothetical protein
MRSIVAYTPVRLDSQASSVAMNSSSAFGKQFRTRRACEPTGMYCRGFGGPEISPAIMNFKKIMFRSVYIK